MINVFQAVDELTRQVPQILSHKGAIVTGDSSKLVYIGKVLYWVFSVVYRNQCDSNFSSKATVTAVRGLGISELTFLTELLPFSPPLGIPKFKTMCPMAIG
jgi:hypothetical protein